MCISVTSSEGFLVIQQVATRMISQPQDARGDSVLSEPSVNGSRHAQWHAGSWYDSITLLREVRYLTDHPPTSTSAFTSLTATSH